MDFINNLENIGIVIYILKILSISIFTYNFAIRIINKKDNKKIISYMIIIVIAIIGGEIKFCSSSLNSMIFLATSLAIGFSIINKEDIVYSILIIIFSLSINYIVFLLSVAIAFIPNIIFNINNDWISLIVIIICYSIIINRILKIKRFKQGIIFLNKRLKNEYFNMLILNISVIIIFSFIVLTNYNESFTSALDFGFIIFSIIMFITIQKSLQLYYKQRLLVQDLEETKKELEDKKKEIKQLEQENLNFSKTSHSIAHKQKALEYKLNELALKNEIAEEIDVKNRLSNITKQISEEPEIEIPKTNISEIDDMLNYMKSECIKNKIKFEVQLNGNIYQMINNHITKEELEILIADHVKNAIIAVKCSNNSNRSILVRIGKIDGQYSIYIYDSGIEFEINTLHKLGKIPSTTHKESGGTGMGFMNTFDTLKKHKASITINEYGKPAKDNYTKVIMIVFNKKDEFNIISYRQKEIEVRKDEVNV